MTTSVTLAGIKPSSLALAMPSVVAVSTLTNFPSNSSNDLIQK